ncbi:MAG: glycosyltransferase family 2 protein, partial [Candidatus Aenigmatarchaeota archaeon]
LVIDDGSKDATYRIAKRYGAIVIKHKKNKGKGEALKTAFNYLRKVKARTCVIIDADLQFLPEESLKLLRIIKEKKANLVMGQRKWSEVPFRHRVGNFIWRIFFNLFFETNLNDTNCGFMALDRKSIEKIKKIHGGYIIENSIISNAIKEGLKIRNVPVKVFYNKKSSILRGIRIVFGVLIFIFLEGIKYKLNKL